MGSTPTKAIMAKKPFKLVAIYHGDLPTLAGHHPLERWSCLVEVGPNTLVFESSQYKYLEYVAAALDKKANPKFLSIQIEYVGEYAKPYKD